MTTPKDKLRAWVHWKKLENKRSASTDEYSSQEIGEDEKLLVNSVESILDENDANAFLLKENDRLRKEMKELSEDDEAILKINERVILERDQLQKENKKLRELWAAVQKHSEGEKVWENIQNIMIDLNKGNF